MITRDVLETLQPGPSLFLWCGTCDIRYTTLSDEWFDWDYQEQLTCSYCHRPVVLACEQTVIDVVAE